MQSTVPEVITLLEEAKESLDANYVNRHGVAHGIMRCQSKITEAQNIMMGERPIRPEEN